jgi:hypothetical protein
MASNLLTNTNTSPQPKYTINGTVAAGDLCRYIPGTGIVSGFLTDPTYTVNTETTLPPGSSAASTSAAGSLMATTKHFSIDYFSDGKYVVVFRQTNAAMYQIFNADGTVFLAETAVAGITGNGPIDVAVTATGEFVIAVSHTTTNVQLFKYTSAGVQSAAVIVAAVNSATGNVRVLPLSGGGMIVVCNNTTTNINAYRYNDSLVFQSSVLLGTFNNAAMAGSGIGLTQITSGNVAIAFANSTTNTQYVVVSSGTTISIVQAAATVTGTGTSNSIIVKPVIGTAFAGGYLIFTSQASGLYVTLANSSNAIVQSRTYFTEFGAQYIGCMDVVALPNDEFGVFYSSTTYSYSVKFFKMHATARVTTTVKDMMIVPTTSAITARRSSTGEIIVGSNPQVATQPISLKRWTLGVQAQTIPMNLPPSTLFGSSITQPKSINAWNIGPNGFAKGTASICTLANGNFAIAVCSANHISLKIVSVTGDVLSENTTVFLTSPTFVRIITLPDNTIFGITGNATSIWIFNGDAVYGTITTFNLSATAFTSQNNAAICALPNGDVAIAVNNTSTNLQLAIWRPSTASYISSFRSVNALNLTSAGPDCLSMCNTTDGNFVIAAAQYNATMQTAKFDVAGNQITTWASVPTTGSSTPEQTLAVAPLTAGGWMVIGSYASSGAYYSAFNSAGVIDPVRNAIPLNGSSSPYLCGFNAVAYGDKVYAVVRDAGNSNVSCALWQFDKYGSVINRMLIPTLVAPTNCKLAVNSNGVIAVFYGAATPNNGGFFTTFSSDLQLVGIAQESGTAGSNIRMGIDGTFQLNKDWNDGLTINQLGYSPPGIKGRIYRNVATLTTKKSDIN